MEHYIDVKNVVKEPQNHNIKLIVSNRELIARSRVNGFLFCPFPCVQAVKNTMCQFPETLKCVL